MLSLAQTFLLPVAVEGHQGGISKSSLFQTAPYHVKIGKYLSLSAARPTFSEVTLSLQSRILVSAPHVELNSLQLFLRY